MLHNFAGLEVGSNLGESLFWKLKMAAEPNAANPISTYKPPRARLSIAQLAEDGDESLAKYRADLGVGKGFDKVTLEGYEGDAHTVIFKEFSLVFLDENTHQTIRTFNVDITDEKTNQYKIKQASDYKLRIVFGVQRAMISGLQMHVAFKKSMLPKQVEKYVLGSYAPKRDPKDGEEWQHWESKLIEEIPSGMIARGDIKATVKMVDEDGNEYNKFQFKFTIAKDWAK